MITAMMMGKSRAGSREEWEALLDTIWDDVLATMRKQKGFIGNQVLWNMDDSGEVAVLGMFESAEARQAYEESVAGGIRVRFESILEEMPVRKKFVVSRSWQKGK